jgi:monovalent cation/hydrogen antiporter
VMVSGIRGVVTLVAVFLLPAETPYRGLLQLLAFVVIAGSLIAGLWLPWVIRKLRLPAPNVEQEQMQRRLLMTEAQAKGLERLEDELTDDVEERVTHRLRTNATFLTEETENDEPGLRLADYTRLRHAMIEAEREAVRIARSEGRYEEYAVRAVLAAIDAEELALKATYPHTPPDSPPGPVPGAGGEETTPEDADPDARIDAIRRASAARTNR